MFPLSIIHLQWGHKNHQVEGMGSCMHKNHQVEGMESCMPNTSLQPGHL